LSDDDAKVDWSLLPHAPLAFFGLAESFDRKELKRAYNRLLRQFKPEKHPQEFQRIRAAYELLDNQLRYGAAATPSPAYQWKTDESPAPPSSPSRSSQQPRPLEPATVPPAPASQPAVPLHVRIRREPLANVYRELAEKQHKLPYDFYALAVMSDVVHRKDGQQFLRWILQGLAEHRHDRALLSLLYEYLRGPLAINVIPNVLVAVSKTVRTDGFFPLTESLWHRLLRERPFAEFRKTLEACEANLRTVGIDARLAFTVEILKAAIWVADAEWINRAFTLIEENFERVAYHLQNDLDLLDFLRRYIAGRPALATASPLRREIDDALREFFSGDQTTRDRKVLQCQVRMAADPQATLAAFPLNSEEDYSNFYVLWSYVSADVAERHTTEREPANVSAWMTRGRALYENIERRIKGSALHVRRIFLRVLFGAGVGVCGFVAIIFFGGMIAIVLEASNGRFPEGGKPLFVFLLAVDCAFIVGAFFLYRFVRRRWIASSQLLATRCYREISREELAAFLQRSQFSHQELRELLFNADITNLTMAQSTADHFQKDYALAIYAIALRFQV